MVTVKTLLLSKCPLDQGEKLEKFTQVGDRMIKELPSLVSVFGHRATAMAHGVNSILAHSLFTIPLCFMWPSSFPFPLGSQVIATCRWRFVAKCITER